MPSRSLPPSHAGWCEQPLSPLFGPGSPPGGWRETRAAWRRLLPVRRTCLGCAHEAPSRTRRPRRVLTWPLCFRANRLLDGDNSVVFDAQSAGFLMRAPKGHPPSALLARAKPMRAEPTTAKHMPESSTMGVASICTVAPRAWLESPQCSARLLIVDDDREMREHSGASSRARVTPASSPPTRPPRWSSSISRPSTSS